MQSRRVLALPFSVLGFALFAAAEAPVTGCHRSGACKGFDSCSDATPCPELRCICDNMPEAFAPTCGADGTCFTSLDCPELCSLEAAKCSKPPTSCSQFSPTQCICQPSGKMQYAAVWDCTQGAPGTVAEVDCIRACNAGNVTTSGAGGSSGTGVGTSSAKSSTATL